MLLEPSAMEFLPGLTQFRRIERRGYSSPHRPKVCLNTVKTVSCRIKCIFSMMTVNYLEKLNNTLLSHERYPKLIPTYKTTMRHSRFSIDIIRSPNHDLSLTFCKPNWTSTISLISQLRLCEWSVLAL